MRSAAEVALVNAMNGAYVCALSAAGTFGVIDLGEIVYNVNGVVRTGLLALAAGNTAIDARLSRSGSLIVVGALYDHA